MFAGFDPQQAEAPYFERHRGKALALAIFVHILAAAGLIWFEMNRSNEEIVEVGLDEPDIENLEIEEEPEMEIEEEPEPEPEPEKPKPKPKNDITNVTEQTSDVSESDTAVEREPLPDYDQEVEVEKKPEKKPEVEKKPEKKVRKTQGVGDRDTPRSMPADATKPKPLPGNKAPRYPESLRKKSITGMIKVKLHVHKDGSVRGMKILKKKVSNAEDPADIPKAEKLFLKEVINAVKTWKFEPAKLRGKTISVWWPVTIPFSLN
jgi:protein TonB